MAKRKAKHERLVEPTWGQSDGGGPPLTELTSETAGSLSPFGAIKLRSDPRTNPRSSIDFTPERQAR